MNLAPFDELCNFNFSVCPLCKKNLPMEKKQDIYLSQEDYQILEEDFLFFQN